MAIKTKKYKSTEKKVVKKKAAQVDGPLNRGARTISRSEVEDLTPGADALRHPFYRGGLRAQKVKGERLAEIRRRRH